MRTLSDKCNAVLAVAAASSLVLPMRLLSQAPLPTANLSVSTHLVQLNVIVRDSDGPVNGLTLADFSVVDQGKARKISVFTADSERAALRSAVLANNTFSNAMANIASSPGQMQPRKVTGTPTIILLDSLNTLYGSSAAADEQTPTWMEDHALTLAKQRLLTALKKMNLRDPIAVYGLGDGLKMLCDFTCSREELLLAVSRYDPTPKTAREAVEPAGFRSHEIDAGGPEETAPRPEKLMVAEQKNGERAQDTMAALQAIATRAAVIPGRKNLLWLTANLPFSGEAIARLVTPAKIAIYPVDARGLQTWAFDSVASGAELDPSAKPRNAQGVSMSPGTARVPIGIEAMQEMAADTGGHAYVNTNDIAGAIREVVEQTVAAYTIGFYVDEATVDGKFHIVKLKVDRPDLTVEYPRGYFATRDRPDEHGRNTLLAALRSPFDSSAIPLEVTIARVEQSKPHMLQVTGSVGIQEMQMPQQGDVHTANLDVYTVEQDAAGNVLHQTTNRMALRLTNEQYQAYLKSGISFRDLVQPLKGTTVMRVLVRDPATQKIGSVVIPLARVN